MIKKNRLKLDFSLNTNIERSEFLNKYLEQPEFKKHPLTASEAETCANYVLWGKDSKTGLNSKQSKEIQLESRNKTWDTAQPESLDALFENPAFVETSLHPITETPKKQTKITFSRKEAREKASPDVLAHLEKLWSQIDNLELLLNYYDLFNGRRKTQPREELLMRFSEEEKLKLQEKAQKLNQFKYLKLRHFLVELRREQFTYRDTYTNLVLPQDNERIKFKGAVDEISIDNEILVYPFGLKYNDQLSQKIFSNKPFLIQNFSEQEIQQILTNYWIKQDKKNSQKFFIDFTIEDHIYNIINGFDKIADDAAINNIFNNTTYFIETLKFYVSRANLTGAQATILDMKIQKFTNRQIADFVNQKFQKSYGENYISTIFKQKIVPLICEAAKSHEKAMINLTFPENFKKCRVCGEELLICADNFTKKSRSIDGYSHRCKRCDKIARSGK